MLYKTDQLYKLFFPNVFLVYDVFLNFFGEQFVDLQDLPPLSRLTQTLYSIGVTTNDELEEVWDIQDSSVIPLRHEYSGTNCHILVYWPSVTVTNENNNSINIQELYAKITVTDEGRIPYESRGFYLNRAHYPYEQWVAGYSGEGYLHSHIPRIPKADLTQFQAPCLGSGPINGTILELKGSCDEVEWMLFCQELAMYVTVESLRGGPYKHLEEVGNLSISHDYSGYSTTYYPGWSPVITRDFFTIDKFKDFVKYYLEHGNITFSFRNGCFIQGMPYYNFIVDISNCFIEWFNANHTSYEKQRLFTNGVLYKVVAMDGKFYNNGDSRNRNGNFTEYIGRRVCTFKGREVTLTINAAREDSTPITTTLLRHDIAMFILNRILRVINFRYKNERSIIQIGGGGNASTEISGKVRYI